MKLNSTEEIEHFKSLGDNEGIKFDPCSCYQCGSEHFDHLLLGQDDLTGKSGNFRYVTCSDCGLHFLNPRVHSDQIKDYYDDDYIAHDRDKTKGVYGYFLKKGIAKHDRSKAQIVRRHVDVNTNTEILDIGCAIGTFLIHMNKNYGAKVTGVDFKDLSNYPEASCIDSKIGFFYDQEFGDKKFDVITMWHFLEHCYNPKKSLAMAHSLLAEGGKIVVEVPRYDSWTGKFQEERWPGVQAPQHLIMFDRKHFERIFEEAGFKIVEFLPWGAFPSLFYIYFGFFFKWFKGNSYIDLKKHFIPYAFAQVLSFIPLMFDKYLNLSMMTIIAKKK